MGLAQARPKYTCRLCPVPHNTRSSSSDNLTSYSCNLERKTTISHAYSCLLNIGSFLLNVLETLTPNVPSFISLKDSKCNVVHYIQWETYSQMYISSTYCFLLSNFWLESMRVSIQTSLERNGHTSIYSTISAVLVVTSEKRTVANYSVVIESVGLLLIRF